MADPGSRNSTATSEDSGLLRVFHFIYDDPGNPWVGGGGSVRVRELYTRLAGRVDLTVVTGNYPGAHDETVQGIRYVRLGARAPYWWSRLTYAAAANTKLRRSEYDVALFDFSGYTPVFLPKHRPTGVVLHHLTSPTAATRWGSLLTHGLDFLERAMVRRAAFISATSDAAQLAARDIAPDTPVQMVGAGVPPELFGIERRPQGFLLYFGRLDVFHKGIDILLEAVAKIVRHRPDVELRIAGRGGSSARISTLIDSLGISRNVRLLGAVSDEERNELFATAAIQVMPSRFEGFGLAAAEAMAAGVPLIASDVGSLPEVVSPPEGGRLVPPSDSEALAQAIENLLDDDDARFELSRTARESARRFDWKRVADDHLRFLQRVARVSA